MLLFSHVFAVVAAAYICVMLLALIVILDDFSKR
jgi:hypothetical protein